MQQINKVLLRGHVGSVRVQTVADKQVARFSVATNYAYKARGGEMVVETSWLSVTAWQGPKMPDLSEIVKGKAVEVNGRIRTQRYTDADGVERSAYEILANQVAILDDAENADGCDGQ